MSLTVCHDRHRSALFGVVGLTQNLSVAPHVLKRVLGKNQDGRARSVSNAHPVTMPWTSWEYGCVRAGIADRR